MYSDESFTTSSDDDTYRKDMNNRRSKNNPIPATVPQSSKAFVAKFLR